MKILVIGSGGREHALSWKLAQSASVTEIHAAPGNAGISKIATCHEISADDLNALLKLSKDKKIDLTIVGPEAPLASGIVDLFQQEGLKIFGPSKRAAQLEASKAFAKDFMQKHKIPTANFGVFTEFKTALQFASTQNLPLVIKADGLAAGKGVIIAQSKQEVESTLRDMLGGETFGDSGKRVVIEQFLTGEEISCIALVDGKNYILFPPSQDHKRVGEADTGPNTGGMGAYSPVSFWSDKLEEKVRQQVIEPTISGMQKDGAPFVGFLYAGIMVCDGEPYVLEYNARLGDPEAQPLLMRLRSDLFDMFMDATNGKLQNKDVKWDSQVSCCVVMASKGYPADYRKGLKISGLEAADNLENVVVFHAGTAHKDEQIVTAGGRVLGVSALGSDLVEARERAYAAVKLINWDGAFCRKDIGARELKRRNHE